MSSKAPLFEVKPFTVKKTSSGKKKIVPETSTELTKKVNRLSKRVYRTTKIEKKYVLQSGQSLSPASRTASSLLLNPLTRGTGVQNRIADRIRPYKVEISGHIAWTQSSATQNQLTGRIIILIDRESNGVAPLCNAVAPANGYLFQGAAGNLQTWSMYNFNNTEISRYKIIYDKRFTIRQGVNTTGGSLGVVTQPIKISKKLPSTYVSYVNGNAGTVADIDRGACYIFFWNDAGTQWNFEFDSCYYFIDA